MTRSCFTSKWIALLTPDFIKKFYFISQEHLLPHGLWLTYCETKEHIPLAPQIKRGKGLWQPKHDLTWSVNMWSWPHMECEYVAAKVFPGHWEIQGLYVHFGLHGTMVWFLVQRYMYTFKHSTYPGRVMIWIIHFKVLAHTPDASIGEIVSFRISLQ